MPVPESLQRAIGEALAIVEQHPDHEYGPHNRAKLMKVFRDLNTPLADKARRRLAILTARHVLPLNTGQHIPEKEIRLHEAHSADWTPEQRRRYEELEQYCEPEGALELAERVMRHEFDATTAWEIACNPQYLLGAYRSIPSVFVQFAANEALCEVSEPDEIGWWLHKYDTNEQSDTKWAIGGDTAADAAAAFACIFDTSQTDPDDWMENWNSWIWTFDPDKLLEFWRWWLTEAIPQAWAIEEATNG